MDASPPPTPVVLLCGAAGAGKTTYARRLEADGFARVSYDDEMWALGRPSTDASPEVLAEADRRVRLAMATSIAAGVPVVLDASLSTRASEMSCARSCAPREALRGWCSSTRRSTC